MDMFEKASRLKVRFATPKGVIQVEDLWDMPLLSSTKVICLDDVARGVSKALKESGEESFVSEKSPENALLKLQFDIVIHIIEVKKVELAKRKTAIADKKHNEKIHSLILDKQDETLKSSSVDELKRLLR